MSRSQDNLQMTFINRSVVISRAVTILRSNETYLRIGGLLLAMQQLVPPIRRMSECEIEFEY